ncbi:hypothetical protein BD626DRAFT_519500 [Schizophyllum amplum]|uniref:C2H2-type domain-containing protein n=1 Tax=Schizophyllum amplum TaxID=97359 RepID=A0A550BV62_9AGAR|nr:hypothetical protein BD626DRAFT_519500 [Auriculariopsis ampla]
MDWYGYVDLNPSLSATFKTATSPSSKAPSAPNPDSGATAKTSPSRPGAQPDVGTGIMATRDFAGADTYSYKRNSRTANTTLARDAGGNERPSAYTPGYRQASGTYDTTRRGPVDASNPSDLDNTFESSARYPFTYEYGTSTGQRSSEWNADSLNLSATHQFNADPVSDALAELGFQPSFPTALNLAGSASLSPYAHDDDEEWHWGLRSSTQGGDRRKPGLQTNHTRGESSVPGMASAVAGPPTSSPSNVDGPMGQTVAIQERRYKSGAPSPHVCHLCGNTFARACNLREHQLRHDQKRAFACSAHGCNSRYNTPGDLRKHVRTKHAGAA